jgi:Uma2 family endonuclease
MALPAGDPPRRWHVADLYELPDDRHRYEIVDGELLVTPPPAPDHQWLVPRLYRALIPWADAHALQVLFGPGVPKGEFTWLEPDLVVYPPIAAPPRWYDAMPRPLVVVEILSPGSRTHDRGPKRRAVLGMGVPEYWLVDPKERSIERWRPAHAAPERCTAHLVADVPGVDGRLVLDVASLFAGFA